MNGLEFERVSSEEERGVRPRWVAIEEMVPPGSFGASLIFATDLVQRKRPETTFKKRLDRLFAYYDRSLVELNASGLHTVDDVLRLPPERFARFSNAVRIRDRLQKYLESLSITPQAKLAASALREHKYAIPIPFEREEEQVAGVNECVGKLRNERQKLVLTLYYGLDDGIERSFRNVGKVLDIAQERVRRIELDAFRVLRRDRALHGFLGLPHESIARRELGFILRKDVLEKLDGISTNDLQDVIAGILSMDFSRVNAPQARAQIAELVWEALQTVEWQEEGIIFERPSEVSVNTVNNLLPGFLEIDEQLPQVAAIGFDELEGLGTRTRNTLKRNRLQTIGDFFGLSREDFENIKWFGADSADEIGRAIQGKFNLPQDQYASDFLSAQLRTIQEEKRRSRDRRS